MDYSKVEFNGCYVKHDADGTVFGFATEPQRRRCEMLYTLEMKKGEHPFEIRQTPKFGTCGAMLDMSRGGVLTVEAACAFIDKSADLGLNMLMLYTEDIYTVPEYKLFGYMRGKYSADELRRIDDHAASVGVELIPCIQTLGHLQGFLRWGEVPSDMATVLLADDPRTYEFVEAEIRAVTSVFRSKRIHIGMDEAYGLGRGKFLDTHAYEETTDIFNRHLARVLEITKKYGLEPMIWSDMYYGDQYYEEDSVISDRAIANVPSGVEMVFWDYYHDTYSYYDKKFIQQERMPSKTAFAGGMWSWDGFLPNFEYTYQTMAPALCAAIDHGIDTVLATAWGNDGVECDFMRMLPSLAVFSEYCYRGKECTKDDIYAAAEYLTGQTREYIDADSQFHCGYSGAIRLGKAMVYADLLTDTVCRQVDYDHIIECFRRGADVLGKYEGDTARFDLAVEKCALLKAGLLKNLRSAYERRDLAYIRGAAEEVIPEIQKQIGVMDELFTENWEKSYKPFGFEKYSCRFGGMVHRLNYVAKRLLAFADGKVTCIPEYDEPRNTDLNVTWRSADFYMTLAY